jgi:hypothetical protein
MRKNDKIYFAVTGVIALAALLFYIFNGNEKLRYKLPAFTSVEDTAVTRIEITGPDGSTVVVERQGEGWVLPVTGHKADADRIGLMLNHVLVPGAVDLVSEIGNDTTYGFKKDQIITLSVYTGDKKVRSMLIGSVSPSGGYSYIRLGDGKKTYTLRGDLPSLFRTDEGKLRDKSVLRYDDKAVTRVKFTGPGGKVTVISRTGEGDSAVWTDQNGKVYETYRLDNIIFRYSKLKCDNFVAAIPPDLLEADSYTVEMNGPENSLTVYGQTGQSLYGTTSQSEEPFQISMDLAKWIFRLFVEE